MPYVIRKKSNQKCYTVKNKKTKKIHSKCTTLEKAKKQVRLLNAIEKGYQPTKKYKKDRK